MRNFTQLLLTAALLFVGVGGVKAEKVYASPANGTQTWTAVTNTFTWNATGNNFIELGLPIGDISMYTNFHVTVSDFSENTNFIRLVVKNGVDTQITEYINAGEFNVDLVSKYPTWDFTKVTSIQMFGSNSATADHEINADNPATVVITDIYLEKPNEFVFDAVGKASINKTGLVAAEGLSYDQSTGVLTSDGTAGTLTLELATPTDLRNVFHFNVTRSGSDDNIVNRLCFYDEDNTLVNTWNGIKWSNTWNPAGIDDNATNAFLNHKPVKKLVWHADANDANSGKTLTITSVEFTLKTISCAKAGETIINTLPYQTMAGASAPPSWNMNTSTSLYYGSNTGDAAESYADVTDYSEIRIYRSDNTGFRAFFINAAGTNVNNINHENAASTWNAEGKFWSIDLSKVEKFGEIVALQGIKSRAYDANDIVNKIVVYKTPAANDTQYSLTGCGMQLEETVAALADASATCIDARGVTGITTNSEAGRTLLTSANPNCLFLGSTGNGKLANTQNVIDNDACAQLAISDGHPFKAPSTFTATAAPTYDRSFSASTTTTVCLPFALTSAEASSLGTFYELSSFDGSTLTFTSVAAPEANVPYLVVPTSTSLTLTQTGKSIAATPANLSTTASSIEFIGTLESTTLPADDASYDYYAYNNGTFVKIATKDATLPAFRAYFKVDKGSSVKGFNIQFEDVDAIDSIQASASKGQNEIFNLAGQRLSKLQKGVNIVNGKKYIIK